MAGGPLITLCTDFGRDSSYVAQLKGVLLAAVPDARLVDISHEVPAQSVRHAEVLLRGVVPVFPARTVHLVVVDPGVGTSRRPMAVEARGVRFVGPDNGVLGIALASWDARAVCLDEGSIFRHPVSPTFHGRDIFAPVAARLAKGQSLDRMGSPLNDAVPSTLPEPNRSAGQVVGETLVADSFGNLLTNIAATDVPSDWVVSVDGAVVPRHPTYGLADPEQPFVLAGSDGFLEVAVRDASAAARLGRDSGIPIVCRETRA